METKYILTSVTHNGRKGKRGEECTDEKYKGVIGSECLIDTCKMEQFKPFRFRVISPEYEWWNTSEVLAAGTFLKNNKFCLEIETANTIYDFERIEDGGRA